MKKILLTILLAVGVTTHLFAQTALYQGGTGLSNSSVGDLLVGTSSNLRYSRLPAGTTGYILQASSTNPLRMVWVATSTLGITGGSGVSGGITDYVARFSSPTSLTTGKIIDNGAVTGINATSSLYTLLLQGNSGTAPLNVASSTGTSLFTVSQLGKVGVGTTSPFFTIQSQTTNASTYGGTSVGALFGSTTIGYAYIYSDNANPAIVWGGDLRFGAESSVGVGFSEKVRITNGGNVGIGTSSPIYRLQLGNTTSQSTANPEIISLGGTFNSSAGLNPKFRLWENNLGSYVGVGISNNQMDYIVNLASADHVWYTGSGGVTTQKMRLTNGGNLGVGTSTTTFFAGQPARLFVDSSSGTSQQGINVYSNVNDFFENNIINGSSGANAQSCNTATNNLGTVTTGFVAVCANSSGFNNPQAYNTGGPGDTSIMGYSSGDFIVANATAIRNMYFLTGGSATSTNTRLTITGTGNVGIGTSTPAQVFSVAGNMRLTGALFDTANASGTTGQILQSTGNGTQWITNSASGVTGTGVNGTVARWTSSSVISNGILFDNGIVAGVGATSSAVAFTVASTTATGALSIFNIATSTNLHSFFANGNIGLSTTTAVAVLSLPQGTTATRGINFGDASANLYRSAASSIKTDGTMIAGFFTTPSSVTIGNSSNIFGVGGSGLSFNGNATTNGVSSISLSDVGNRTSSVGNNQIVIVSGNYVPAAGTGTMSSLESATTYNQVNASGITRGFYFNPTVTKAADLRAIEIAGYTYNLSSTSTAGNLTKSYGSLFNQYALATTSPVNTTTIPNASMINIIGAPKASSNVTISSSTALVIEGGTTITSGGTTTNAYSLYISQPTSAVNNYTAYFGDKIGIGSTTPTATLTIKGAGTSSQLSVASSSGKVNFAINQAGHSIYGGTAPTVGTCGTAPSIVGGNDVVGRLITGSGVITACTVTFAQPWSNPPICDTNIEGGLTTFTSASTTLSTMVITGAAAITSSILTWQCNGY